MSNTVDRKAETKEPEEDEDDEVDRVGPTEEPEVDRDASTQEPPGRTRLILHVHPSQISLLKGIPNKPKEYPLGQSIIFGRGENVNIFLNDHFASKRHLELTYELHQGAPQGLFKAKVIGRQSTVNDILKTTGDELYLRPNDVIKMGQLRFTTEIINGNDHSSYILEFKKGSRGPNPDQGLQHPPCLPHQPPYQIPQYPPQIHPYNSPGQMHQPFVQPPLSGYPGLAAMPVTVAAYPASFPNIAMQPISPGSGPSTFPVVQQHSPIYGQVGTRREDFQSGGRSASENDDRLNPRLSVEETQPSKMESLGDSFEDTNPPKH
ncbi:uncharacterized protein LOC116295177 [Actinia tenebrosa]|uniref:Uncharacterized protein LOC116295177 n=1 Tax=Actinia tenebrosa TaxID=6105 RepID=A0A6P8HTN4_ACTTE|nr:uncharacterized protein LOC116295177 [Actinia tenebrosa]